MPDRAQIGEVVTIVVVTVVFTEIVIEAVAITIGVTVTATVAAGVASSFAKRRKEKEPTCEDRYVACMDDASIADEPGNHWRSSLCNACRVTCKKEKKWPQSVPMGSGTESCIYKGY